MHHRTFRRAALAGALYSAFVGCTVNADTPPIVGGLPQSSVRIAEPDHLNARTRDELYVATGSGSMYEFGLPGLKLTSQFAIQNCAHGAGIKIDTGNNLYIPNSCDETVSVYPRGSRQPGFVYSSTAIYDPYDVAVAGNGDVYVANNCCPLDPSNPTEVLIFHRNVDKPYKALVLSQSPYGLALDQKGDLFVTIAAGSLGDVLEFPAGESVPVDLRLKGLKQPVGIVIDSANNIVIYDRDADQISIYPSGSRSPSRKITGIGNSQYYQAGYIALSPNQILLFVSAAAPAPSASQAVVELDYTTGKLLNTIGKGDSWSPAGVALGARR